MARTVATAFGLVALGWALLGGASPARAGTGPPTADGESAQTVADRSSPPSGGESVADADLRPRSAFDRASQALLDGQTRRAAHLFELAAADPDEPRAADALFSAAQLYQTRLNDALRALGLYRQLAERFPDARAAAAARLRATDLANELENGPRADALVRELDAAISRAARDRSGHAAQAARAISRLAADNPEWPGTARALDWLGAHYRAAGRLDEARDAYRTLAQRFPNSPRAGPANAAATALDQQLARAHRLGWLDAAGILAALLGLAALLAWTRAAAGSWRRARPRLLAAPGEALYAAPVGLALSFAAWTVDRDVGVAVAWVCASGIAATWLVAASAKSATSSALAGRLLAAIAVVTGTALCALNRTGLLDRLLDSAAL